MARRSTRISSGSAISPAHKRVISNSDGMGTVLKRPKRGSRANESHKGKISATNSSNIGDDENELVHSTSEEDPAKDSEFTSGGEDDPTATESDDKDSVEDATPQRKKTPRKGPRYKPAAQTPMGELWMPGAGTGLGPGKQVIIKKPKPRPAGKTPYSDDTIHPNTMLFLQDLKENNDRDWLKIARTLHDFRAEPETVHDADFRQSERDWHAFVEKITEKLVEIDDTVPELPVKDVVSSSHGLDTHYAYLTQQQIFRIYRDVRFSSDPTPYKPYFSAAWSRTGRKGPYAHYYVQISPDNSFVGGGLWHPDAAPTATMRRDIHLRPRRIKDVLLNESIRREFLHGVSKSEANAVKAFVSTNSENALKTKPKGYDADHADIQLLRLRNYTLGKKLSEADVTGPSGLANIARLLTALKPFITYLNSVVMPDGDDEASGDEQNDPAENEENEENQSD